MKRKVNEIGILLKITKIEFFELLSTIRSQEKTLLKLRESILNALEINDIKTCTLLWRIGKLFNIATKYFDGVVRNCLLYSFSLLRSYYLTRLSIFCFVRFPFFLFNVSSIQTGYISDTQRKWRNR